MQYFHMICRMKQNALVIGSRISALSRKWSPFFMQVATYSIPNVPIDICKIERSSHYSLLSCPRICPNGYFSIARSNSPGSGNWTDITMSKFLCVAWRPIEGWQMTEGSLIACWQSGLVGHPYPLPSAPQLKDFAGLQFTTVEQHVDYRTSRHTRNAEDWKKLFDWFTQHPQLPQLPSLVSLATGIVGNSNVNCQQALKVRKATMAKVIGQ